MKRTSLLVAIVCSIAVIGALASPSAKAKPKKPKLMEIVQTAAIPVEVSGSTDVSVTAIPELQARLLEVPGLGIVSIPQLEIASLPGVKVEKMPDLNVALSGSQSTTITSLPQLTIASGSLDMRITNDSLKMESEPAHKTVVVSEFDGTDVSSEKFSADIDVTGWEVAHLYVSCTSGSGNASLFFVCDGITHHAGGGNVNTQSAKVDVGVYSPKMRVRVTPNSGTTMYGVKARLYLTR